LLVEDNEISQKLLKKQLVRAGCSVVTANDGVEAVEFMLKNASSYHVSSTDKNTGLDNAKVELILMGERSSCCVSRLSLIHLDIEMPRKGGLEATQDIRSMEADGRLSSRIPVIAVSANARSGQIEAVRYFSLDSAIVVHLRLPVSWTLIR
jgi:CheY-like chemotaxis protein